MPTTISQEFPFSQIPNWVTLNTALTPHDKTVYMVIATHADRRRTAFPGIRRIADEACVSPTTVQNAINNLERVGALVVSRNKTDRNEVNHYRLPMNPAYQEVTQGVPADDTPPVPAGGTQLDESSLTTSTELQIAPNGALTPHNQMMNSIVEAMGWKQKEVADSMWGEIRKASKALRDLGVDPWGTEVARRARIYQINQPGKLSPSALVKWWADCAEPKVKPSARDVRDAVRRQEMAEAMRSLE